MESFKGKDAFLEGKNIVLGLSGGVDSVVLLHYLHTHYPNNLRAVHCNHHLSSHCDEWQAFCGNVCDSLNVPFTNINLLVKPSNVEENARKSRYISLSLDLKQDEVLCTAHHKNDQAETLLLQLFRGSGVAGLASMPTLKVFSKGTHYRPLLTIEKSEILQYAKDNNLTWVEDDSNFDTNFRRNFLRLDIIPKLENVYKNLTNTLARSAKHQSESLHLTQDLAKVDIEQYQILSTERLNVENLKKLTDYRIKNILRYHLTTLDFLLPSDKVTQQILDLLSAKEDATPLVTWGDFEIRRYQNELYFINNQAEKNANNCTYHTEFKDKNNFSIRYRKDGQRITLPNKNHSQSLKKVLQEAGIPPWERNTLKMYYVDNELRAMERIGYVQHAE
ncbi:tRNA(Ile)-lysidine synthetase [hydrothermal vent metagenome]|uniref:tRNA(Ile)-lysidine synthetase n=1 Tax=hydrothermal vent metagenome TaxID=652676 RepID=A0A1W1DZG9_9ZZZZ